LEAGEMLPFRKGEHGRHDDRAWVRHRRQVRVVVFVGVPEGRVEEGGLIDAGLVAVPDDGRAVAACELCDGCARLPAPRQRRTGDLASELIQDHPLGQPNERRRQVKGPRDERRELLRETTAHGMPSYDCAGSTLRTWGAFASPECNIMAAT